MKRPPRHRRLSFELLEPKVAPSSVLLVMPGDNASAADAASASVSITTDSIRADEYRYETEEILRFIDENTVASTQSHRAASQPTEAECAASDEMMRRVATDANSLFVHGFNAGGSEL